MSTSAEFAPYEYHDGNDIVGIDVDIANAICEDMGSISGNRRRSIRFHHPESSVHGKADFAAAGMTVTGIVRHRWISLILRSWRAVRYRNRGQRHQILDDLKGKQIGVQQGHQ